MAKFQIDNTPSLLPKRKGGLTGILNSFLVEPLLRGGLATFGRSQRQGESDEQYRKVDVPLLGEYERPVTQSEQAKAIGLAGLSLATDILPMLKLAGTGVKLAGKAATAGGEVLAKKVGQEVVEQGVKEAVEQGVKDTAAAVVPKVEKEVAKLADLPIVGKPTGISPDEILSASKKPIKIKPVPLSPTMRKEGADTLLNNNGLGKLVPNKLKKGPTLSKTDSDIFESLLKPQVPKAQASKPLSPKKLPRPPQKGSELLEIMSEADDLETLQMAGRDVSAQSNLLRQRLLKELEQYPLQHRQALLSEFLQKIGEGF